MSNHPEYQMEESVFHGYRIVELLHNGAPIHEFDEHFRFGENKAILFLACMSVVKELAFTPPGEMPDIEKGQTINDEVAGTSILVEFFREFERSDGRRIKVPWVKLTSLRDPNVYIGIGRQKAKAIVMLRKQLAEWANYPLVDE